MITNATYAGSSNTLVYIEPDNINVLVANEAVIEWVNAGNTVNPYIEPMGDNKVAKYAEIYAYADSLIEAQEATFFPQGGNTARNKERLTREQNRRNNKKIKGDPLTPEEDALDDRYDSFMDFADSIYDTADLAEDEVELMTNVSDVKNYDVVNSPAWPIWIE